MISPLPYIIRGGPNAMKRRTFVVKCRLPHFKTKWLVEVDGQNGVYRNPVVLGRELKEEMERGKWRTQADFAATLGMSPSRLRSFICLATLHPDVERLFISLGSILPKGCFLSDENEDTA